MAEPILFVPFISIFLFAFRILTLLTVLYSGIQYWDIKHSFTVLRKEAKLRRLILEDEGVEGTSWFAKERTDKWHSYANGLRIITAVLCAPFFIFPPHLLYLVESLYALWTPEPSRARPYDAVLAQSPSEGALAEYHPATFHPRWLLKVEFRPNATPLYEQVTWSEESKAAGYTALSYPVKSAFKLFREAGRTLQDPSPFSKGRRWSLRDRQRIAEQLLFEYALGKSKSAQLETEYVWLDEFCLSDKNETDPDIIQEHRTMHLGRLSDIFGGAAKVVVFCHERDCDHSGPSCPWGARIFALSEILHPNLRVVRMTRTSAKRTGPMQTHFFQEPAKVLRRAIQTRAEADKQWHLHAVMQQAGTPGAFSQQTSIHSLVVEAIRRDEASNFRQHHLLGKALNGLLPRRARLGDLPGKDGWADLAWLLELNQGFYNATALAAVSSLKGSEMEPDDGGVGDNDSVVMDFPVRHPWLGKPILPSPGTERLEPIVYAFPVCNPEADGTSSALNVVGAGVIPVQNMPRRDAHGLFRNEDMDGLRIFCQALFLFVTWIDIDFVAATNWHAAITLFWLNSIIYCCAKLAAGTMYLIKDGWVYLEDKQWGENPQDRLSIQDSSLGKLSHWGDPNKQPIPKWHSTSDSRPGTLADLRNQVYTKVNVISCPNSMVPLAIHGSGITCMLLDRPDDASELSERVGMANLPTHSLCQASPTASICIGGKASRIREKSALAQLLIHSAKLHMTLTRHFGPRGGMSRIGQGAQATVLGSIRGVTKSVHFEEPTRKEE